MRVNVRDKVTGCGVWWVFVRHRRDWFSTLVGSLKAATKVMISRLHPRLIQPVVREISMD